VRAALLPLLRDALEPPSPAASARQG